MAVSMLTTLAYVDPGVSSLLLQALVGGGAGLMVLGKYVWRTWVLHHLLRR